MGQFEHGQGHDLPQERQAVPEAGRRPREQQHGAGAEHAERGCLGRHGREPSTQQADDAGHPDPVHPQFVPAEQQERRGERQQVIDRAVREQGAEQSVARHVRQEERQHEFEHADAAGHGARDAGRHGDDVETHEPCKRYARLRRQQDVEHSRGDRKVRAGERNLQQRDARPGQRECELADAHGFTAQPREHHVGRARREQRGTEQRQDRRIEVEDRLRQPRPGEQ